MQKDDPIQVDVRDGSAAGTRIYQITGPITLPNLFAFQDAVRQGEAPRVAILDLCKVPYMDSAGMGSVINFFTHCQKKGVRLLIAGVSPRVSLEAAAALELGDEALGAIARAARERTLDEHTAARRVEQLERIVESNRSAERVGDHSGRWRGHAHPTSGVLEGTAAGRQPL